MATPEFHGEMDPFGDFSGNPSFRFTYRVPGYAPADDPRRLAHPEDGEIIDVLVVVPDAFDLIPHPETIPSDNNTWQANWLTLETDVFDPAEYATLELFYRDDSGNWVTHSQGGHLKNIMSSLDGTSLLSNSDSGPIPITDTWPLCKFRFSFRWRGPYQSPAVAQYRMKFVRRDDSSTEFTNCVGIGNRRAFADGMNPSLSLVGSPSLVGDTFKVLAGVTEPLSFLQSVYDGTNTYAQYSSSAPVSYRLVGGNWGADPAYVMMNFLQYRVGAGAWTPVTGTSNPVRWAPAFDRAFPNSDGAGGAAQIITPGAKTRRCQGLSNDLVFTVPSPDLQLRFGAVVSHGDGYNGVGGVTHYSDPLSIGSIGSAPFISFESPTPEDEAVIPAGLPVTIQASVTDPDGDLASVYLEYRAIGAQTWGRVEMAPV